MALQNLRLHLGSHLTRPAHGADCAPFARTVRADVPLHLVSLDEERTISRVERSHLVDAFAQDRPIASGDAAEAMWVPGELAFNRADDLSHDFRTQRTGAQAKHCVHLQQRSSYGYRRISARPIPL